MFEILQPTVATLVSVTNRSEKHGDAEVPAVSFGLKITQREYAAADLERFDGLAGTAAKVSTARAALRDAVARLVRAERAAVPATVVPAEFPPLPDFQPIWKNIMTISGSKRVEVYNALVEMLQAYARAALAAAQPNSSTGDSEGER